MHAIVALIVGFAAWTAVAAEPLRIGFNTSVTGVGAEAGQYELNGARLAVDEVNRAGGVLGRPIALVVEDNQTTNPGAVAAFGKLSGDAAIVAVAGPSRSTQINAVLPNIARAKIPVMIGGSDPSLTRQGNPWVFRCRPTDNFGARVMAEFGATTLKAKRWAIVHSTDTFGVSGMTHLVASLKAMGIVPVLVQGYTNKLPDFTPVVLAVKQAQPDLLATYVTLSEDLGIFAKQLRQLGFDAQWIGSTSIVTTTALNLAGPALHGTYSVTDYAAEASPEALEHARRYREAYGVAADIYSAWSYDAVHLLARAMNSAKSIEPEAIRNAILAIRGHRGIEGQYYFEPNGDALRGFNIVKNNEGRIAFIRRIDFDR
jgi:branched-chain amino acid transport system substrate-binding protein